MDGSLFMRTPYVTMVFALVEGRGGCTRFNGSLEQACKIQPKGPDCCLFDEPQHIAEDTVGQVEVLSQLETFHLRRADDQLLRGR